MMVTTRRRFLTILGVGAAGTILPAGYTGATGAIIQAVEDPVTRSINMARDIVEWNAARSLEERSRDRAYLNRSVQELMAYMNDQFPHTPYWDEVAPLFQRNHDKLDPDLLRGAHLKEVSYAATPVAILRNLFGVHGVYPNLQEVPAMHEFTRRLQKTIFVSKPT